MATPPMMMPPGGGGGSPMAGQMARSIIDNLSAQGASPMQQGGITGGPAQDPNLVSQMLAGRMAELGGADPKAVHRLMTQIKQQVAVLIPQLAFRIPGVTKHLSGLFNNIDKILEEITRALQTQNAVAQQSAPLGGAIAAMQPAIGAGPEAGMPNLPQMGPNLGL